MGSENDIPVLDFSEALTLEEGSEGWKELGKKVREAFESHGLFLLKFDGISNELRDDFFNGMKSLFDLPEETKKKFYSPRTYRGYTAKSRTLPYADTFGIDNDSDSQKAKQEFINLMWPEGGNPTFCNALTSISEKAENLSLIIMKMLLESFGMEPEQYKTALEELYNKNHNDTRMTRYQTPEDKMGCEVAALLPHTDKGTLVLISDNGVQGLQLLTKTKDWVDIHIPSNGFVAIIGDILKAWSNGRLEAPIHRVVTRVEPRCAFMLFSVPKEGLIVKAPSEMVDEIHPLRYKPFDYEEYLKFDIKRADITKLALEEFAGL